MCCPCVSHKNASLSNTLKVSKRELTFWQNTNINPMTKIKSTRTLNISEEEKQITNSKVFNPVASHLVSSESEPTKRAG